jgi:hypothetical protein
VRDGTWTGPVGPPPSAISGSVHITVIAGGRIETDFSVSSTCATASGQQTSRPDSFEIGPLPTVGQFIAADGSVGIVGPSTATSIGGVTTTAPAAWEGRFGPDGVMRGTFSAPTSDPTDCGARVVHPSFTAGPLAAR